jgi:hypothetical protein
VLGERPHQPERDHLVGEAGAPVSTLGYPELHVEPEQVLLDRCLRHDQVTRDLPRRGGRDERLVGERGTAQRYQHVKLASGQFGGRGAAEFRIGGEFLPRQPFDPAAGGAEGEDVTVVKHAAGDGPPVYPGAVT